MFGELAISQLLITSTTISFLSSAFVIAEVFCGNSYQYSHKFEYSQTYVVHNDIPKGFDKCLIRLWDGRNVFTKLIEMPEH